MLQKQGFFSTLFLYRTQVKVQQISDQEKMKQMEREIKELKRANEILRKAAAFFAQAELDRPHK